MRLSGIFQSRSRASLLSFFTLWLWSGIAGAAQGPAPQNEPIEEIEITGRASRLALRADIVDTELRMFNLFNQLNDVPEFKINCEAVIVTTSRIADRECVPVYMKRMRHSNVQNFLFSDITPPAASDAIRAAGGKSMDIKGVQESEQQMWFRSNPKHREFNAKFRELAAQNPALASAALELQTKQQRLEELEQREREESALGRFFSRFGGND
jgi:hypothetical protein